MTEKVVLKIKLSIVEYGKDRHWHLHMTDFLTRHRDIASSP